MKKQYLNSPLRAIYNDEIIETYLDKYLKLKNKKENFEYANEVFTTIIQEMNPTSISTTLLAIQECYELAHLSTKRIDFKEYTPINVFTATNGKPRNVVDYIEYLIKCDVKKEVQQLEYKVADIRNRCNRVALIRDVLVLVDGVDDIEVCNFAGINSGKHVFQNLHWFQFFKYSTLLEPNVVKLLQEVVMLRGSYET